MSLSLFEVFSIIVGVVGFIGTVYGILEKKFDKISKENQALHKELRDKQEEYRHEMNRKIDDLFEIIRKIDKETVTHKVCEKRRERCMEHGIESMKMKTKPIE